MKIQNINARLSRELQSTRWELFALRSDTQDAMQAIDIGMLNPEETAIARLEITEHTYRIRALKRFMFELFEQVFERRIILN